ncbi:MAG: hypothetical protein GQ574_17535 [Crocinitomix sp.]|nr:hypothetical protein [Crocinitomix sp.]
MKKLLLLTFPILFFASCGGDADPVDEVITDSTKTSEYSMEFETLNADKTGIDFYNTISEDDDFNFFNYEYIYNGGGVAVGDINNDGLTDIYFTGNQVQDKLYLNKGDMVFEDISNSAFDESANIGWHTGVNMVDFNADGYLDIYVCRSGNPEDKTLLQNMLFINNQDNTFTERAAEFGVNVQKRSTHAAFFDYDNDGDLDLYVLNHPIKTPGEKFVTVQEFKRLKKFGEDADVFLENQDGMYVDVSKKVGIENNCFGLGIAVGDLDGNGYSDVYVSNDYQDPDFMYMNNGDGTFSQEVGERTRHISNFSMGNDIADFNNDGYNDVFTVDMASEDHVRSKRNMGGMSTKNFWDLVFVGFHYQYMFNGLQMNNGDGTFTEVSQMAGISKTDWSWAPLFADFDNDGKRDLFVTNGYNREARDNDYTREYVQKEADGEIESFQDGLDLMPTAKIYNYIYKNDGDIHFTKKTVDWKFEQPVNSSGAAFADFDNDGDLDLVVNNMEEASFIMENKLEGPNNYVRFNITGSDKNTSAIGATIKITNGEEIQFHEIQVSRGYESSVERIVHFGLGENETIDKVEIKWINGDVMTKENLAANQVYNFSPANANGQYAETSYSNQPFRDISDSLFEFFPNEVMVNDFESEVLLPHKMSQLGPFISKGDVNGDGLEDFYVSGAADFPGRLMLQNESGFKETKGPWAAQKAREELGSEMLDVDNDGDLDLYIVSGGNEYAYNSPMIQDQLYINDGKGKFTNETLIRLPKMETSGQRIAVADYDADGDLDMFVAGRQTPGYYPFSPRSFLLQNNGEGVFTDVAQEAVAANEAEGSRSIMGPGMVTDALFDDFDGDDDLDLIVVGEWMPITFFENREGKFADVTNLYNPKGDIGWWYSISKADYNGDGKNDYVVGNVGTNNKFHPSTEKPLHIYCHDFDENGTYDIVLAKKQGNICYPVRGRSCSSQQMPFITEKFPTFNEFATADVENIYGKSALDDALHYSATNFHSVILLSGTSSYTVENLPVYSQLGPVNKSISMDVNKDGNMDLITVGNNFVTEVETMRYDGGRGAVLLGDGKGNFEQLTPLVSGFFESEDCKDMTLINFGKDQLIITVSNLAKPKTFMVN